MNIVDLVSEFEVIYELGSLGLPGFEDSEIRRLLEIEQYKLINQRFGGNNTYGTKFPDTSKRIDDLLSLLTMDELFPFQTSNLNEFILILPSDYLHFYELRIENINNKIDIAEQVTLKESQRFNAGAQNQEPYLKNYKFTFGSDSTNKIIRVYYDTVFGVVDYNDNNCYLTYIKTPEDLTMVANGTPLTDFNIDVYHELVRSAVDNAIFIVTPQKSQVSQQQLKKTE